MTSKDQSFFSVYQDAHQEERTPLEHEIARLRNKTDASECHGKINMIANILREL